ncbi:MAG: deoxynucleoside kinase [Chloroflexi bacterium]|nr:deoxynucleoside kinase [Chloroflexota bacterium]
MKKLVAIAGNIGVGKTSLTSLLSDRLGWKPFYYEIADHNPYLPDFYADMRAWSFQSQMFILSSHARQYQQLYRCQDSVVKDRTIYEDGEIFAKILHEQGNFQKKDYHVYIELYRSLIYFLPKPDLTIYLRASVPTLMARIARQGREYERDVSATYLEQLNELYERWAQDFVFCPVLTVPADDLDFVYQPQHLDLIVTKILDKLQGKEVVSFEHVASTF